MICKKCKKQNKQSTQYCIHCGYELSSSRLPVYSIISSLLILLCVILLLYYFVFNDSGTDLKREINSLRKEPDKTQTLQPSAQSTLSNFLKITFHFNDNKSFKTESYLTSDALLAVQTENLRNIKQITCKNNSDQISIMNARWIIGSPLVFLSYSSNIPLSAHYKTDKWLSSEDLYFLNADSNTEIKVNSFKIIEKKGDLLEIEIENPLTDKPAILIQKKKLVGWVFPDKNSSRGFLWLRENYNSPSEEPDISVQTASLFLSDKESLSSKISALPHEEIMRAFVSAMELVSLSDIEEPALLKQTSTVVFLILSKITETGYIKTITSGLHPDIVAKLRNPSIMEIFAWSFVNIFGYEKAIKQMYLVISSKDSSADFNLKAHLFLSELFADYLQSLLSENNFEKALSVYLNSSREFSDNKKIKLLGAEIYIALKNPQKAEEILNSSSFESKYSSTIDKLRRLIAEELAKKNKIAIKFEPNHSDTIFLNSVINDSVNQRFVVDTGATFVSIPSETARLLKIDTSSGRERAIATASGMFLTKEITLNSISINGKKVFNIPAVIIDLPEDKGLGLLGMSFLNRFNVELNSNSGELFLTPKEIK